LLEPIMKVSINTPEDYLGDVISSVSARRGRIEGMEDNAGSKDIQAVAPLAELFGYTTSLRSMTQGRGSFTMQPSHYEEVSKNIQEDLLSRKSK